MSHESEAADLLMRQGLNLSESAVKLAALGAKHLAALVLALAKDNQKLKGKTKMTQLLTEGKELRVLNLHGKRMKQFAQEAQKYGILFSVIKNSKDEAGNLDVMFRAEDSAKVNHVLERMGYGQPEAAQGELPEPAPTEKNADTRARQESKSAGRGSGSKAAPTHTSEKPSVRDSMEQLKDQQKRDAILARAKAMQELGRVMGVVTPKEPER